MAADFLAKPLGQDHSLNVADEEVGRCLDPKENGVNPGGGNGVGPSTPGGSKISSRGGGNILMEQLGRLEEEFGVTRRTHHAQSM